MVDIRNYKILASTERFSKCSVVQAAVPRPLLQQQAQQPPRALHWLPAYRLDSLSRDNMLLMKILDNRAMEVLFIEPGLSNIDTLRYVSY